MNVDPKLFGSLVVYYFPDGTKTQGRIRAISCSAQGFHFLIERTGQGNTGFDSVTHKELLAIIPE